ncbi:MAG: hypothetical protein V4565_09505 [Bacteroidota bacterium]
MKITAITFFVLISLQQNLISNIRHQLKTIDFINLTSTVVNDDVEITCEISKYNNRYFIVEQSNNAIDFIKIDTVYELINQRFKYIDTRPQIGISYYRIRRLSINGEETVSNITSIDYQVRQSNSFEIIKTFPIPFSDALHLDISCKTKMRLLIKITNSTGLMVFEDSRLCEEGINNFILPELVNTGNNFYYLSISDEKTKVKSIQLLKQNIK